MGKKPKLHDPEPSRHSAGGTVGPLVRPDPHFEWGGGAVTAKGRTGESERPSL